jgi:thiaminase (transcriptional activator TenA)
VSLAQRLWVDNADLAGRALAHSFVRGVADGSLPREVFSGYVAQDAFFLEAFARAYALALAASPDTETVLAFAGLIAGVRDELSMHAAYAARWGVDPSTTSPAEATLAYTEFLLATAATGTVGLVCAAMTPCMRLYAHLGQSLAVEGVAADHSSTPRMRVSLPAKESQWPSPRRSSYSGMQPRAAASPAAASAS